MPGLPLTGFTRTLTGSVRCVKNPDGTRRISTTAPGLTLKLLTRILSTHQLVSLAPTTAMLRLSLGHSAGIIFTAEPECV